MSTKQASDQINVLVVDDHALVRAAIDNLLKEVADINIVAAAGDGEEALKMARKENPDVVLMDISMPGMSGIEVTRRLLQINSGLKVIALTAHSDELYSSQLLKTGAVGYLTKDVSSEELVKAIRIVMTGKRYLTPHIAEKMASKFLSGGESSPLESLSNRELEILLMVSRGEKVAEIAKKLFISSKTVNTYRYKLFEKLDVKSDVELTKLALQHGLIQLEEI